MQHLFSDKFPETYNASQELYFLTDIERQPFLTSVNSQRSFLLTALISIGAAVVPDYISLRLEYSAQRLLFIITDTIYRQYFDLVNT